MIVAIVGGLVLVLAVTTVVLYARDPGPSPVDVAIGYELAWDRLDFQALWALSGPELRDGLDRDGFIAAKSAAYAGRDELVHLAGQVDVDGVEISTEHATVHTRLTLRNGTVVHNDVELTRRSTGWSVSAYSLVDR